MTEALQPLHSTNIIMDINFSDLNIFFLWILLFNALSIYECNAITGAENCSEYLRKVRDEIKKSTSENCINNWVEQAPSTYDDCTRRLCYIFITQEPHLNIKDETTLDNTPFD